MNLAQIIREDAQVCVDIRVQIERHFGLVKISNVVTGKERILQDTLADGFIKEFEALVKEGLDVTLDEALRHLARQYIDMLA